MKGQKSRSGSGGRLGFQGGQLALIKSLPMIRGFTNIFRKEYSVVNLHQLERFPANSEITPQVLVEAGLVKNLKRPVKILGRGEVVAPLMIRANRVTGSAREKIEAAGGSVEEIV